jgi:hypothetical protein
VQTEINENAGGVGLDEIAGSGDLARGSEGGEFHEWASLVQRLAGNWAVVIGLVTLM